MSDLHVAVVWFGCVVKFSSGFTILQTFPRFKLINATEVIRFKNSIKYEGGENSKFG